MAQRQPSRNVPCPCGSGKKYKRCCWDKGFTWSHNEPGQFQRAVPLSPEALRVLQEQQQKFHECFGRGPDPDDLVFFDAPPLEQVEHHLVEGMKRVGLDPAFIHAFEKTGLLVTEENQHLISEKDLEVWHQAIHDYRLRHRPPSPPGPSGGLF